MGGVVPLTGAADKRVLIDTFASMRAAGASYRRAAVRARRRARLRKIAVAASIVGVAAYAENSRRAAA